MVFKADHNVYMAWVARKIINDTENLGYCLMTATPDSWHSHSSQKFCHGWQLEQDMMTLKTFRTFAFFLCQNMAQKHVGMIQFTTDVCSWEPQPAAVFAI